MTAQQFLPYATAGGANVETQADYLADGDRTAGVATGVARSAFYNKAQRQGSFWGAVLGTFIVDQINQDVLDDGDVADKEALFEAAILQLVSSLSLGNPPGSFLEWSTVNIPAGYLLCNGAVVNRADYPNLNSVAAAIGYTAPYGAGNGSTTFKIPDFRGYFMRAWDNGAGVDPGRNIGSVQGDLFAAHSHDLTFWDENDGQNGPGHGSRNANSRSTSTVGGSETRPKNVAVAICIKT